MANYHVNYRVPLHNFMSSDMIISQLKFTLTSLHPRGQLNSRDGSQLATVVCALVVSVGCGYSYYPSRCQQVVSLLIPVSIAIGGELIKHEHTIWSGYVSMQFNVIIWNCCPPSTATTAAVGQSYSNDQSWHTTNAVPTEITVDCNEWWEIHFPIHLWTF